MITNVQCELRLSEISVHVLESLIFYLVAVCLWRWFRQDGIRPEYSADPSSLGHLRLLRSLRRSPYRLPLAGLSLRLLLRRRTSTVWAMVSRSHLVVVCLTPDIFYGNVVR